MTTLKEYKTMMEGATDAPWSCSEQQGTKGHCFQAQIWDSDGDSLATIEPTVFEKYATSDAQFIAASRNIAPDLIRVIELAEEALNSVVDDYDDKGHGALLVNALSEIRKLKG